MARPDVADVTDEAFAGLGPWARADGDVTGWALLFLLEAMLAPVAALDPIIRDTDDGPGWSAVLDIDRTPPGWVAYTGQYVGVTLAAGLTDEQQRSAVRDAAGWKRGTVGAIRAAAQLLLTGTKRITVTERYGANPYALYVGTYAGQTPDPAATEAAIRAVKPGGITLTYELIEGLTIDELVGTIDGQGVTLIDDYADMA